ncbi:hypothetical protein ACHAXA_000348 [Cyclostephanos tholiformis]|uniref:Uncharacterized protein n=1 Tax=Cyclostephanos tholiformis TaxID=382380 RepID=A0ABD3R4J4_9STRA
MKLLVTLLAASSSTTLPCSSFVVPINSSPRRVYPREYDMTRVIVGRSARDDDDDWNVVRDNDVVIDEIAERGGKFLGSALVALVLTFSPHRASAYDDVELELETREIEKEAKVDEKKARIEKSREAFFEYEARMAEEQESRIEAAEFRAEAEYNYDKEQAELLASLEKKAEGEMKLATTPQERAAKAREARELLRKKKEIERKERRAERAEKIYLAEEKQEQIILRQKEDAALAEEKKFEAVEKEYETVAELAKEEEVELGYVTYCLSLLKQLSSQKK